MEINKILKTKKGTVRFQGELTEQEHELVLSVGLNELMSNGALPFTMLEDEELMNFPPVDPEGLVEQ